MDPPPPHHIGGEQVPHDWRSLMYVEEIPQKTLDQFGAGGEAFADVMTGLLPPEVSSKIGGLLTREMAPRRERRIAHICPRHELPTLTSATQ